MSRIRTRKFRELEEVDTFLSGGVISGADIIKGDGGVYGLYLVGLTLKFAQPSAVTVTFVASVDPLNPDPTRLTFKDIKAQIETAIVAVTVKQFNRRLLLIEATPTNGITIDKTGTATRLLGFDANHNTVGIKYGAISTTAPCLQTSYAVGDTHVITTWE